MQSVGSLNVEDVHSVTDTEDIIDLAGHSKKTSDFGVCKMARLDMQKREEKDAQKHVELPKPNVCGSKRREKEDDPDFPDDLNQVTNSSSDAMLEDRSSTRPIKCTDTMQSDMYDVHKSIIIRENNGPQKYYVDNMQTVSTTGISKRIQIKEVSDKPHTSSEEEILVLKCSDEEKGQNKLIDGRNRSGNEDQVTLQMQVCCHENENQQKVIPEKNRSDGVVLAPIEFSSDTAEDNCGHAMEKKGKILLQVPRGEVITEKDQRCTFQTLSQSGTKIQEEELQSVVPLTGSNLRTGGRQKELKSKWKRREVKWTQNFHHAVVTLILFLYLIFCIGRSSKKKGTLKALIFVVLFAVCSATDCDKKRRRTEHLDGILTRVLCEFCDLDKPPDPCYIYVSDFFAAGGKAGTGKTTLISAFLNQLETSKETKLRNKRLFVKKIFDDGSRLVLFLTIQHRRYTSDDWINEDLGISVFIQIEDAFQTGLYILCILSLDDVSGCCCSPECRNMDKENKFEQHSEWRLSEESQYRNRFHINTEKVNSSKELPFHSATVKSLDHSVSKSYIVLLSGFTITCVSIMLGYVKFKVIMMKSCKLCVLFENFVTWILLLCDMQNVVCLYCEKNKIPPDGSYEGESCVKKEEDMTRNEERDDLLEVADEMENTNNTNNSYCVDDELLNYGDGMGQDVLNFRATSSRDTEDKFLLSDKSFGALIWNDSILGTGFRLEAKFVMTAFHVIRHIGEDKIAEVDFNTSYDRFTSANHVPKLKKILFSDETLDIAVIEISNLPSDDFSISMTCKDKNPGVFGPDYFEKNIGYGLQSSPIEKRNLPNIDECGFLHIRDLNLNQYFLCERTWNLDLYIGHGASGSPLLGAPGSLEIFSEKYMKKTCDLIANTWFEDPADFILRIARKHLGRLDIGNATTIQQHIPVPLDKKHMGTNRISMDRNIDCPTDRSKGIQNQKKDQYEEVETHEPNGVHFYADIDDDDDVNVLIPNVRIGAAHPIGETEAIVASGERCSSEEKENTPKKKTLTVQVVPNVSSDFFQQSNVKSVHKKGQTASGNLEMIGSFKNLKYKIKTGKVKKQVDCTFSEEQFERLTAVRNYTWLPLNELPVPEVDLTVAFVPQFEPLLSIIDQIANGTPPTPHVSMRYELLRFCTLRSYPKENKPYLIKLAEAGFYYASDGDGVVCYCCGVRRYNWVADDIPMKIHERINPNCKFLRKNEEVNVPVQYFGPFSKDLMAIMDIPEPRERSEQSEDVNNDWAPERVRSPAPAQQNRTNEANSLGINTAVPKHTQYATKTAREGSYSGWPDTASHTPQELAEAGFFYAGFGDCVRCFYCGIGLRHWTKDDNPWIEHARWSRNCVFVKQKKGEEFVNLVQLAVQYSQDNEAQSSSSEAGNQLPAQEIERILLSDAAQSVLEMGYQPRIIKKAIEQILRQNGDTKITAQILMGKVLEIEEAENPAQAAPAAPAPPKAKPAPQTAKPEVSKPVEGPQAAALPKTEEKPEGDKTSVEGKDKGGFRAVRGANGILRFRIRFPLETWNVHQSTMEDRHRTNNLCESWNNSFRVLVGHSNPSMWTVINCLQKDNCLVETELERVKSCEPTTKQRKKNTVQ